MEVRGIGPMSGPQPAQRITPLNSPKPLTETRPVSPKDVLDISPESQIAGQVDLDAEFRAQRLSQIQQQIADGTYDTEEKFELAFGRMLQQVLAE